MVMRIHAKVSVGYLQTLAVLAALVMASAACSSDREPQATADGDAAPAVSPGDAGGRSGGVSGGATGGTSGVSGVSGGLGGAGGTSRGEVMWQEPIEVDRGHAQRGPWRMNESEFHFVDDPTVAYGKDGAIAVAWADQRAQDIRFQRYNVAGEPQLDEPTNVSRSGDVFSWLPRMIVGGDDDLQVFILWQEIVFSGGSHGGEIYFARSSDGGETFSEPINLSNTEAGAGKGRLSRHAWHNGSLDLARADDGTLYAAWTEYEGNLWFSRSTDGGESFTAPEHVAGDERRQPARGPTLAVAPEGDIYLAWTHGEDPQADIHIAASGDEGRSFEQPRTVAAGRGHADGPSLAVDPEGTLHLAWAESADGHGRGDTYHIRYARRGHDADDFEQARLISRGEDERVESVSFPSLDVDGDSGVYLLWELFPDAAGRSRGLGFTHSMDGGDSFHTASVVPGTVDRRHGFNGSQQGLLMNKLAVDDTGRIAVVNSTFNRGRSSHIWLLLAEME